MGHLARLLSEPTAEKVEPDLIEQPPIEQAATGGGPGKYVQAEILAAPVKDATELLERYGHDPETVRLKDGFSVSHRELADGRVVSTIRYELVERAALPDFGSLILRWREPADTEVRSPIVTDSATYVIPIADGQLGKPGTSESVENLRRGVLGHCASIRSLQALGMSPEGVHVAWLGDETEGVSNNYGNQPYLIELNQSQQLELDFDLRVWALKEVAKLGLPISASSVISNHGEFTRNGSKDPVTTRYDNSSTFIARQVKKLFDEAEQFGGPHIEWTIGDTTPGVIVELSGEPCYFTHGYVEKGRGGSSELKTKNAIEKQILGDVPRFGNVRIFVAGHYHHLYTNEFEGRTLFGSPALEATIGSKDYMLDQFGVWSPPGMLGMLVGSGFKDRGWSSVNVF